MPIDTDTLHQISQGPAIDAADRATHGALPGVAGILALPDNFETHDMENRMPLRRRARGDMTTSVIDHFAAYVAAHKEAGASVFVDSDAMTACAVLNLGTPAAPGHADNTATFKPKATAAFKALRELTNGMSKTQRQVAEYMEDWSDILKCLVPGGEDGPTEIANKHAVAAIRTVTIEALQKSESTDQNLSASRSTLDSVKASSGANPLPIRLEIKCCPYLGMEERTFALRLVVHLDTKAPTFSLHMVKSEEHAEQIAEDLVGKVSTAINNSVPVMIGGYKKA